MGHATIRANYCPWKSLAHALFVPYNSGNELLLQAINYAPTQLFEKLSQLLINLIRNTGI